MDERQTIEYWNERAKKGGSPQDLVYASTWFNDFDRNARQILSLFKDKKVLDVGCGFGRMSDMFTDYTGIDPSEEMIKLANERYPDKRFLITDNLSGNFDVIFEIMSLSSIGCTAKEFSDRHNAKVVICLEPYEFNIFYK